MIGLTFLIEILIMVLIHSVPEKVRLIDGLMHSLLLIALQLPFIYFLLIKPMLSYIEQVKQAQQALVESENHFRSLADGGEALIWTTDADGNCNYLNQPWLNFTGRTLDQEIGPGWMEGLHPDDKNQCLDTFKTAFELHEKFTHKYRIRHADGQYRWIQDNGTPCFDKNGQFTGYIGHCLDINELVLAQEQLREKEKSYRTIFEYSPIPAVFYDGKGTILFWNKAAEKTFCWTKEETIGRNVTLFFKPDYERPEINYDLERELTTLGNRPLIKEFKRKDGTIIICEWNRTIFYDSQGKIRKVISIAKDITEQQRYEAELIATKEKAQESERLKSAFLANMSHELRSPLNSIIGFSELLTDPDYDYEQKMQFAQMINKGGNNLLSTIVELMDFSRIDSGQIEVNSHTIIINRMLEELHQEYSFKAAEKGIKFNLDIENPQHDIIIESDEVKLRQILINFITNAIKFTSEGFIEVGLRTTESFIQFHVKDTGIGIPSVFQDSIFERFRQIESHVSRKHGGIGLGLAISKSLVELLGGNIWIESEEGKGSIFFFTIPAMAINC